jgi:hypothetical protein
MDRGKSKEHLVTFLCREGVARKIPADLAHEWWENHMKRCKECEKRETPQEAFQGGSRFEPFEPGVAPEYSENNPWAGIYGPYGEHTTRDSPLH